MNQNQSPMSRKVERTFIVGPVYEGAPSSEVMETIGVQGAELLRSRDQYIPPCVSCNRIAPLVAKCVVCSGLMCGAESCQVQCVDEACRKMCCPEHRVKISGEGEPAQYLCQRHYDEVLRERAIIGLVALLVVGLALWQCWPR